LPRRRFSARSSRHAAELAVAVPFVVAHRLARLAAAGHRPTARDRREFRRMVDEKGPAFAASWLAMWAEGWRLQQQLAWSFARTWWAPWLGTSARGPGADRLVRDSLMRAWGAGLAPLHRAATANARRLGRRR
jgi:hypothetical protein